MPEPVTAVSSQGRGETEPAKGGCRTTGLRDFGDMQKARPVPARPGLGRVVAGQNRNRVARHRF
jgi:hypothetical protein